MTNQYTKSQSQDLQSLLDNTGASSTDFSLHEGESLPFVQQTLPEFVRSFANEDEGLVPSRDSLRNMFNTLEKNELIDLLTISVMQAKEARSIVGYSLSNMTTFRRLLVRNISFHSTSDEVKDLLSSRYGMIEEGSVVYDRMTGKSKGFAFMTFATVDSACNAIIDSNNGLIELGGRQLLLKFAADRIDAINTNSKVVDSSDDTTLTPVSETTGRRLYISGLSPETTTERLTSALSRFGTLEECFVVCDAAGNSRKFGFATFASEDSAWQCMQQLPTRPVDGQLVLCQVANDNLRQTPFSRTTTMSTKGFISRHNTLSTTTSTPARARTTITDDIISNLLSGIVSSKEVEALWGDASSSPDIEKLAQQFQYL